MLFKLLGSIIATAALVFSSTHIVQAEPVVQQMEPENTLQQAYDTQQALAKINASQYQNVVGKSQNCVSPIELSAETKNIALNAANKLRQMAHVSPLQLAQSPEIWRDVQLATLYQVANNQLGHDSEKIGNMCLDSYDKQSLATGLWASAASPINQGFPLWIKDDNTKSVGHRLNFLSPKLAKFAVGGAFDHIEAYTVQTEFANFGYTHVESLVNSNNYQPKQLMWPPAGYLSANLVPTQWSLHVPGQNINWNNAKVKVTGPNNQDVSPNVIRKESEYFFPSVVFEPKIDFASFQPNTFYPYQVSIEADGKQWNYTVKIFTEITNINAFTTTATSAPQALLEQQRIYAKSGNKIHFSLQNVPENAAISWTYERQGDYGYLRYFPDCNNQVTCDFSNYSINDIGFLRVIIANSAGQQQLSALIISGPKDLFKIIGGETSFNPGTKQTYTVVPEISWDQLPDARVQWQLTGCSQQLDPQIVQQRSISFVVSEEMRGCKLQVRVTAPDNLDETVDTWLNLYKPMGVYFWDNNQRQVYWPDDYSALSVYVSPAENDFSKVDISLAPVNENGQLGATVWSKTYNSRPENVSIPLPEVAAAQNYRLVVVVSGPRPQGVAKYDFKVLPKLKFTNLPEQIFTTDGKPSQIDLHTNWVTDSGKLEDFSLSCTAVLRDGKRTGLEITADYKCVLPADLATSATKILVRASNAQVTINVTKPEQPENSDSGIIDALQLNVEPIALPLYAGRGTTLVGTTNHLVQLAWQEKQDEQWVTVASGTGKRLTFDWRPEKETTSVFRFAATDSDGLTAFSQEMSLHAIAVPPAQVKIVAPEYFTDEAIGTLKLETNVTPGSGEYSWPVWRVALPIGQVTTLEMDADNQANGFSIPVSLVNGTKVTATITAADGKEYSDSYVVRRLKQSRPNMNEFDMENFGVRSAIDGTIASHTAPAGYTFRWEKLVDHDLNTFWEPFEVKQQLRTTSTGEVYSVIVPPTDRNGEGLYRAIAFNEQGEPMTFSWLYVSGVGNSASYALPDATPAESVPSTPQPDQAQPADSGKNSGSSTLGIVGAIGAIVTLLAAVAIVLPAAAL